MSRTAKGFWPIQQNDPFPTGLLSQKRYARQHECHRKEDYLPISTPVSHSLEVFTFNTTGYLIANTIYDVVAWGYHSNRDGYFMTCDGPTTETGSPSDLTIYSRIEGGPP